MKKIISLSLALSALVFTATAQEQRTTKAKKHGTEQGMKHRKGGMQDLNLTEAQKSQLKASREEAKAQMEALKSQNLSEAELKTRRKAIFEAQRTKMESILTAEQKAKMAEGRKANKAKFAEKNAEGKFDRKKAKGNKGKHDGQMKEKLALTDDQAAKLKAQKVEMKKQKEAIKNNTSLSAEAKKQQMKSLKAEAKKQRNLMLTADQIAKMEQMKKDRKNKSPKKARK